MDKEKLVKSDELYYRIQWQQSLDTKQFFISYWDGILKEYKTIPFNEWVTLEKGGDIPWHRVYYFYKNEDLLWDRTNRIFNEELLLLNDVNKYTSNVKILKYNKNNRKWLTIQREPETLPNKFKLLTYNCLFDLYKTNPPLPPVNIRLNALLKLIQDMKQLPDIILLQEITLLMRDYILSREFIQENYLCFDYKIYKYGQLTLFKQFPTNQNVKIFNKNLKSYHQVSFNIPNGQKLQIYNIHLTSDSQRDSSSKRKEQIEELKKDIDLNNPYMIIGDFNTDESIELYNTFDVWKDIYPNKKGYTYNYINNPLAKIVSQNNILCRIDRILSTDFKANYIDIVGKEPIDGIYISDHYGLITELEYNTSSEITYISEESYESEEINIVNSFLPGTALRISLPIEYWNYILKYLPNLKSKPDFEIVQYTHLNIFEFFISTDNYIQYRPQIQNILHKYINLNTVFDTLKVFENETKSTLVLVPSNKSNIIKLYDELCQLFDTPYDIFEPHINLISSDKTQISKLYDNLKGTIQDITIELNHLENVTTGKYHQIWDTIYFNNSLTSNVLLVVDFINIVIKNVLDEYKIEYVGSKSYDINMDGDYDIIVIGKIPLHDFYTKLNSVLINSYHVKYCQLIDTMVKIMDIELIDNSNINIFYYQSDTLTIVNDKTDEYKTKIYEMITSVNIVKEILKDNIKDFCKYYNAIKKFCKNRKIYSSNYCYLNGIALLVMTIQIYLNNKEDNINCIYDFLYLFVKYYSEFKYPDIISLNDCVFNRRYPSDNIMVVLTPSKPYTNILRRITKQTLNIIINEFKMTSQLIKSFPAQIVSKEILRIRKIEKPYVIITVSHIFNQNAIQKYKYIASVIWKIFLKLSYFNPDTQWKSVNVNDNTYTYSYKFGIKSNEFELIINDINKFNVDYQLIT
jgi:endonuclease/exonuclease/phosphatase family metal-dependent hydrolase